MKRVSKMIIKILIHNNNKMKRAIEKWKNSEIKIDLLQSKDDIRISKHKKKEEKKQEQENERLYKKGHNGKK